MELEKYNPIIAEVSALVENVKTVVYNATNGKVGLPLLKENKSLLQKKRTEITTMALDERKELRGIVEEKIKENQQQEKDLLELLVPVENELKKQIDEEEEKIALEKKKKIIPFWKEQLEALEGQDMNFLEEELILLDEKQYGDLLLSEKNRLFDRKIAEQEAENKRIMEKHDAKIKQLKEIEDKLDEGIRKMEEDKRLEEARREGERIAQEKALKDAELAKLQAEKEKQDLIDEQARQAQKKIDDENAQIAKEKVEKEALEKKKKYQKWLRDNEVTEAKINSREFIVIPEEKMYVLYKLIDTYEK